MKLQILEKLGFSQKEIEVYTTLLAQGRMTPAELAKTTGINRPTVYSVAKELIQKGVVTEDLGGASRTMMAKPPADLAILVNREARVLETKKELVEQAIIELGKLPTYKKYDIPRIVFVPHEDVERYLYKQAEVWTKSVLKADGLWWGFQDHTFVESFQAWVDWYWKTMGTSVELNLLTNTAPIEEEMKRHKLERRHMRFWKPEGQFTATTWICGDYIVMIDTRQKLHHLVEIHDAAFANNLRLVFKDLWRLTVEK